jgi:hypothetical protein
MATISILLKLRSKLWNNGIVCNTKSIVHGITSTMYISTSFVSWPPTFGPMLIVYNIEFGTSDAHNVDQNVMVNKKSYE